MNILMVHNYYQIPGGEDTVVANEKKMLEDHGHEVILYTRHNSEIASMTLLKKIFLPIVSIFNLKTYLEIKNIIKTRNIDIVHVHNTLHLVSQAVYYAAVSCGVPVLQTVHNFRLLCPGATFYRDGHICEECVTKGLFCAIRHKCYRQSFIQTFLTTINTWIHRKTGILKKINYICLTEFTKNKLLKLNCINKANVYIKPNFVQKDNTAPSREIDDYYLFLGRLEEIKGIDLLVDSFKEMPDKKLLIIGTGALESQLMDMKNKGVLGNVEILGFVQHEKVGEYLRKAKALIMCSQWYETFGMVIVEAYCYKTPVLVGRIGNIKDLVIEGKTGYTFEYNSKRSLKEAVFKMDKSDNITMGENAYQEFQNMFTEKINYKQIMSIYNAIAI